jgi:chitodextrinase
LANSVSLSWNAASDNVGVAGYGLYRNGASTTATTLTSTTFTGLACATSYTFAVDAFDDAGNRSSQTSVTASTAACPPDTQAPTAPSSIFTTGSSTTSVSISWQASFDNVAVAGYGLYRNGTQVATSGTTSATFGGLTCGTSYTLAVDAYDAAGNRSAKASTTAATAACPPAPDTQAPTAPSNVSVTGTSATSVSLGWGAASDNVGVTGYGLYRDGTLTGTGTSTSTTFSGLTCGTSYTLAIDAYDAAGNRSAKASTTASTAACATPPPPPPTGSANVYVSPGGSDSTCVRSDSSKPCASFNKAFSIAQSGDVVQVAAGAYGSQSIAQSTKSSAVTVRPAAGANVTVASLSVNASHFHIEGIVAAGSGQSRGDLDICGSECNPGLVDVLIKDGGFRSAFIRASGVTVQGGDYGGFDACNSNAPEDGFRFWGGSVVAQPTNDVVDGVTIHDITSGSGNTCQGTSHAGYHVDCMQNQGGQNITIRNSTFYNCPTSDIQMEPFSGATIGNVTIENNFFGPTECCNSIVLGTTTSGANCSSLVIRYNVLYNTPNPDQCGTGGNGVQVYGNVFPSSVSCSNDSFDHNVFPTSGGSTCGTAAKRCTPAWVSTPPSSVGGAKPDAHLLATDTCAKAAGDASRYPTTDLDGQSRPQGSTTPDAGPDEIG